MNNQKSKVIEEYILESKENLILAADIVSAFDNVVESLVQSFLIDLEIELQETLGGEWIIGNSFEENVFGKASFCITKKSWREIYSIGFCSEMLRLKKFSFYIWRDKEVMPNANQHINQLMNAGYKKGSTYENGDWWQFVDGIYSNWTENEVLLKLYQKEEMLEYFKVHLIQIKDIVEEAIDQVVEEYNK